MTPHTLHRKAATWLLATLMIGRYALIPGNEVSLSGGAAKAGSTRRGWSSSTSRRPRRT